MSIAIDGMPAERLVQAVVLEIVTGLACIFALVKFEENRRNQCDQAIICNQVKNLIMRLLGFSES